MGAGAGGGGKPRARMQRLARLVRRSPWVCNALLYGSLFAAGDAVQQQLRRRPGQRADWAQTGRVALVALTFHANFNYLWLRGLERLLPGRAPAAVLAKVGCDQLVGAPVAILAFYSGELTGEGRAEPACLPRSRLPASEHVQRALRGEEYPPPTHTHTESLGRRWATAGVDPSPQHTYTEPQQSLGRRWATAGVQRLSRAPGCKARRERCDF